MILSRCYYKSSNKVRPLLKTQEKDFQSIYCPSVYMNLKGLFGAKKGWEAMRKRKESDLHFCSHGKIIVNTFIIDQKKSLLTTSLKICKIFSLIAFN